MRTTPSPVCAERVDDAIAERHLPAVAGHARVEDRLAVGGDRRRSALGLARRCGRGSRRRRRGPCRSRRTRRASTGRSARDPRASPAAARGWRRRGAPRCARSPCRRARAPRSCTPSSRSRTPPARSARGSAARRRRRRRARRAGLETIDAGLSVGRAAGGGDVVLEHRDVDLRPGAHDDGVIDRDGRELGRGRQQEDRRLALRRVAPWSSVPSLIVYVTVPRRPGRPDAVVPDTRR